MNVELAFITLLMIVPLMTGLSLWFRSASNTGYLRVRDGIAAVLSRRLGEPPGRPGRRRCPTASATTCSTTATSSASTATRNDDTARVVATYGASTEFVGIIGPGDAAARRRARWSSPGSSRSAS